MRFLRYATNDDTTMLAIAAGGYGGEPSPYLVNIHYLIGCLLKSLYTWIPSVNWFTVWYLFMYVLALVLILYIIVKSGRKNSSGLVMCFGSEILSFYLLLNFFSFTVVAYALLTAGMMGIVYVGTGCESRSPRKGIYAIAISYIILAAMMRSDVINTAIVMVITYGITTTILLKEKQQVKRIAMVIVMLAGIELMTLATNTWLLDRDNTEAAFYAWGEIRSKALDCTPVSYDEKIFSDNGFSKASYDACYGAFYYIRNAVSIEKLRCLIDWNSNRYHPHIIGYIKSHLEAYTLPGYRGIWQGMFILMITACIVLGDKKTRCKAIALYLAVITADYAYHFIGRPMLHVMMPTYVMGSLMGALLLGLAINADSLTNEQRVRCRLCGTASVLLVIISIVYLSRDPVRYSMTLTEKDAAILKEGRKYMRDHPDMLFVALDPSVFAVSTDEDMWHNRYATEPYNLAGNWEIYSLPSNTMLESYGIDPNDPGRDLVDNDRVIFLSSRTESFDPNKSYISELYKEYYGMEGVKFIPIDNLKNWTSWRLSGN